MEFSLDSLQPKERASFALRALYEAAGCRKYHKLAEQGQTLRKGYIYSPLCNVCPISFKYKIVN